MALAAYSATLYSCDQQFSSRTFLPLLKRIHALPCIPEVLRGLTFPELLVTCTDPTYRIYESIDLNKTDPLFAPLNQLIQALERHEELDPSLREVRNLYQEYIEGACLLKGKERRLLLKGPSRHFALIQGKTVTLFSLEKVGKEVVSIGLCSTTSLGKGGVFSSKRGVPLIRDLQAEESSPFEALQYWIAPYLRAASLEKREAILEQLSTSFSTLIAYDELLPQLLAERGSVDTISLAFCFRANLNRPDRQGRSPLHRAAKTGRVEIVRALVECRVTIDLRDLNGRTPLHLAALWGHQPVVEALIELRGDPQLMTNEGETLLHLAVISGDLGLVLFLLKQPFSEEWLYHRDSDGKTPLHRAVWGEAKKEIVDALTKAGAPVNLGNIYGYTALHWAAKHGHIESVRLLIKAGSQIDILNQNGESPFDLALTWGQDEVVWLLLTNGDRIETQLSSSSRGASPIGSFDSEGTIYRAFEAAYDSGDLIQQIFWLEKLGKIYIDKKNYITAAHLMNGALAIVEKSSISSAYRRVLLNRLERIEGLFILENFKIKSPSHHRNYLTKHREELQRIRAGAANRLEQGLTAREVQELLTKSYRALLGALIDESIALIGRGYPNGFAVMGLGSMARSEMAPYSDLEFAFLVRDPSPSNLDYFRQLSQLLILKIINMGETKCEILRFKRTTSGEDRPAKSLVHSGFSVDIGGLCPNGKSGVYELIGSPKQLAELQTEDWLRQNDAEIILVNAMTTVCCVAGDQRLVVAYEEEVNRILNTSPSASSSSSPIRRVREIRAFELMQGYVREFCPRLNQDKIDLRGFDVKHELYRLPQTVISGLALYYDLRSKNTLDRIEELRKRKIITDEGAKRLKNAFRLIVMLRIRSHLFYKSEKEVIYHSRGPSDENAVDLFVMTPAMTGVLCGIYRTLIPLHETAQAFLKGEIAAFSHSTFYNQSVGEYDRSELVDFQTGNIELVTSAVALNPNNITARADLGTIHLASSIGRGVTSGEDRRAIENLEESLSILRARYPDTPHLEIAKNLMQLGHAYKQFGNYDRAIEQYHASLEMFKQLISEKPSLISAVGEILINLESVLGEAYNSCGKHNQAIDHFNASLMISRQIGDDQPHDDVISQLTINNLTSLAGVYLSCSKHDQALEYLGAALAITMGIHNGEPHLDIVKQLDFMAAILLSCNKHDQANEYFDAALTMKRRIYADEPNDDIVKSLYYLGLNCQSLKNFQRSIDCFNAALTMKRQLNGDKPNTDTVNILRGLAFIYKEVGDLQQVVQYFDAALRMRRQIHNGQPHLDVVDSLMNLGDACKALNKTQRAIESYEEFLVMKKQLNGDRPDSDIVDALNNLGDLYSDLGEFDRAAKLYESCLMMSKDLQTDRLRIS